MTTFIKRTAALLAIVLVAATFVALTPSAAQADEQGQTDFLAVAKDVIAWQKSQQGKEENQRILDGEFLQNSGTSGVDWYVFSLGRLGVEDNFADYVAVVSDKVAALYADETAKSLTYATEWHRLTIALNAAGGDPRNVLDPDGNFVADLVADGSFEREGGMQGVLRQGNNGVMWALISLDSKRYAVPEGASVSREQLVEELLRRQLADGSFDLAGVSCDVDLTAMAVQALAPYYNDEKTYRFEARHYSNEDGSPVVVERSVRQAVDSALAVLSEKQLADGDFFSSNTQNCESTCQVIVALTSLGIDPLADARFVKGGKTLFDGLMKYHMQDGGFAHTFDDDPTNPFATAGVSNDMASQQALYALAALWRNQTGMRTLYDCRREQTPYVKARLDEVRQAAQAATEVGTAAQVAAALQLYYALPEGERSYCQNYVALSDLAKQLGVDVLEIASSTVVVPDETADEGDETVFTEQDKLAATSLPSPLTTKEYVPVTALLYKLNASADFYGKTSYERILQGAKAEIAALQEKIKRINEQIAVGGFSTTEGKSLKDKKQIDAIYAEFETLSDYDKTKVNDWDDFVKTKIYVDDLLRAVVIAVCLAVFAVVLTVVVVRSIKKRKRKKLAEMEELSAQFDGDDN